MGIRKSTVKRVKAHLAELKDVLETTDVSNIQNTLTGVGLKCHTYSTVLRGLGLVEKVEKNYYWAGGKVTKRLVEDVVQTVNEYQTAEIF